MIAKSIRVVALGVLLAAVVAGSAQAASCEYLGITWAKSKMKLDYGSIKCKSGSFPKGTPDPLFIVQNLVNGPNCTMTFRETKRRRGGKKKRYSTIRVQQNFCGLKAGKITVQMHLGAAVKYTKKEGSYLPGRNGHIVITGFK